MHYSILCNVNNLILQCIYIVPHFLFQPDPIDGIRFKPIKIDIHQGVIKIVDDEIFYDFQLNTTESVIVGLDRDEVLDKIQRGFENQYNQYGKLKREDIQTLDYETMQTWKILKRHVIPDT
jgi:hypothetical protein